MASTFTTNFGFEAVATGDQAGTWGTTTNFNLDILDRIASYAAVALSDASTATLTVRTAITETEVTSTAKKRAMTAAEKTNRTNSEALSEILRLEEFETPSRIAEALPDDSGGSVDGRAWFKVNRGKLP
jgi:hypothetical protein